MKYTKFSKSGKSLFFFCNEIKIQSKGGFIIAYVPVPRDLTKVKSKIALNLTLRQLICFGTAAAVGLPTYFMTRGAIGNAGAVLLMIGIMLPAFFVAIYEKDGQPAEKILINMLRLRLYFPTKRPYKTENFYNIIEKEGRIFDSQNQTAGTTGKTAITKRQTGNRK